MHLTPQEIDKLTLHQAGFLAQKRLARGTRLNHPEAVALIATQLLELIRDGRSVAELMDLGKQMLGRRQVMSGVAEMIHDIAVDPGRRTHTLAVTNTGDRPIQVGSHYPFDDTNPTLAFDRASTVGMRLD